MNKRIFFVLLLLALAAPVRAQSTPLWFILDAPGSEWHRGETFRLAVGVFSDAPTHGEITIDLPQWLRLDILETLGGGCDMLSRSCFVGMQPNQPGVAFADLTVLPDAPIPSTGTIGFVAIDSRGNRAELQIIARIVEEPAQPAYRVLCPLAAS